MPPVPFTLGLKKPILLDLRALNCFKVNGCLVINCRKKSVLKVVTKILAIFWRSYLFIKKTNILKLLKLLSPYILVLKNIVYFFGSLER